MKKAKKDKDVNTNTNKVKTTVIVSILLLSVFTATTMLSVAQVEGPHQFWGNVTVNGVSAPDGTTVVAKIGGEVRGSTTTVAGTYGEHSYFDVTGTTGDNISFYVADGYATYYIFEDKGTTALDLSVTVGAMPDLEIADKWVCWPDNCTICYNVTNTGSGTASAGHNTTLYVDGNETAHAQVPVDLAPSESYIGCFESYAWVYTPPDDNITVCADNNETVGESDEGNNCLTNRWKCGDVDGDGSITITDARIIVGKMYGEAWCAGYPDWPADADCDKTLTITDARIIVGKMYGEAWCAEYNCCCMLE